MTQKTFANIEHAAKRIAARRERFRPGLKPITPWGVLIAALTAFYQKGEWRERPPIGLERMLQVYIVQQSLGLSDKGIEDALYGSLATRQFVKLDQGRESAPDATSLLSFRHLLDEYKLTESVFATVKAHLVSPSLMLRECTIVDTTITTEPSSTKIAKSERDRQMHQTKKGKQWHFGMKALVGVDADSGGVHMVISTIANVSDNTQAFLHGKEHEGFGDSRCQDVETRPEVQGKVRWNIAHWPEKRRTANIGKGVDRLRDQLGTIKTRTGTKVEPPFRIVKNRFGLRKARCRGLAKNTAQLMTLFGLANLMIAELRLLQFSARGAS